MIMAQIEDMWPGAGPCVGGAPGQQEEDERGRRQ
jgi:hypothetical protein